MNTFKPVTHRGITYFAQHTATGWTVQTAQKMASGKVVRGAIRRYKSLALMICVIPAFRTNALVRQEAGQVH
jgi:hypothetical protein